MNFKKILMAVLVSNFIINHLNVFSSDSDTEETPFFLFNTEGEISYTNPGEDEENEIDYGPDNTDEEDWDIRVLDTP